MIFALEVANKKGWNLVWIETDSLLTIHSFNDNMMVHLKKIKLYEKKRFSLN